MNPLPRGGNILARQGVGRKAQRDLRSPSPAAACLLLLATAPFCSPAEAWAQPRAKPGVAVKLPAAAPFPPLRQAKDASAGDGPARAEAPAPPPAPPCLETLKGLAVVLARPPIVGPGGCGAPQAVRLEAVFTRSGRRIALQPAADLRCGMAEAVVRWVREDVVAALPVNVAPLSAITTAASYDCRTRNHVAGALISEHGLANALDIRALLLADGTAFDLTDRTVAKSLRERLRATACARFSTVLGPGSDGFHEDHIHFDMRERRSAFRLCRWDVLEPAAVASAKPASPPMPATRPTVQAAVTETKPLPQVRRGPEAVARLPLAASPEPRASAVAAIPMPPPRPVAKQKRSGPRAPETRQNRPTQPRRSRPARRAASDPFRDVRKLFRF
jgi:hypothetical protein